MGHIDEPDIDSAGTNLGGYKRGRIVSFQSEVFLSGVAGAVIADVAKSNWAKAGHLVHLYRQARKISRQIHAPNTALEPTASPTRL